MPVQKNFTFHPDEMQSHKVAYPFFFLFRVQFLHTSAQCVQYDLAVAIFMTLSGKKIYKNGKDVFLPTNSNLVLLSLRLRELR